MVQSWTDRETAVCFQGAKAKQLHHNAMRSWVCNNDKRIVPWGRKHLHTGDGGVFFFFFLVDEHKVHGPFGQTGRNNKVHWEKAKTKTGKKQSHEILMWYIYWQATRTSRPLWGLRGKKTCAWLTTTRCRDTRTCLACPDTETHS